MILGKEPITDKTNFVELPNKQFDTMNEMLKDAEKYLNRGEKEVSMAVLNSLLEYIERYKIALK